MSQRLSRKEIKRDEFMESLAEAVEYVRGHSRNLIYLVVGVVVALLLLAIYLAYAQSREQRADASLAEALKVYQAEVDPVAANPDDSASPSFASVEARADRARELFEALGEEFQGTDAASIALAYLGQIAALQGDLETARGSWEEFLSRASDHALAVGVKVNLMALDRASGRGDELVTELRAQLSGGDTSLPIDLLLYQLALTLEQLGRQSEANDTYQRIVDEHPQSVYAQAARERSGGGPSPPLFGS